MDGLWAAAVLGAAGHSWDPGPRQEVGRVERRPRTAQRSSAWCPPASARVGQDPGLGNPVCGNPTVSAGGLTGKSGSEVK